MSRRDNAIVAWHEVPGVPPGRRPHMVSDPAINRRATVVCPSGTRFGRCRGHDPRVFPSFSRKKDLLTTEEVMKLSKLQRHFVPGSKGQDNWSQGLPWVKFPNRIGPEGALRYGEDGFPIASVVFSAPREPLQG
jgi:hypothetical protein